MRLIWCTIIVTMFWLSDEYEAENTTNARHTSVEQKRSHKFHRIDHWLVNEDNDERADVLRRVDDGHRYGAHTDRKYL